MRAGDYIEYNGDTYIIVAFDGNDYWLVREERVEKANQLFDEDMFTIVPKDELEQNDDMEL